MLWGRGMAEDDFNGGVGVFVGDNDFRTEGGCETLLAVHVERWPESGKAAGFEGNGFDGEVADFERGSFAFEFGQFFGELAEPVLEWCVEFFELLHADSSCDVEVVELFRFRTNGVALHFDGGGLLSVFGDFGFRPIQMGGNLGGVREIVSDAAGENLFQRGCGDLVLALRAGVIGAAGVNIHLPSAAAFEQSGEDVDGLFAGFALGLGLRLQNCADTVECSFRNDGGTFHGAPFAFRFRFLFPPARVGDAEEVRSVKALGAGASEHPVDVNIHKLAPAPGAIAFLVEHSRDDAFAAVDEEKVECLSPNRRFRRYDDEMFVGPFVSERREAVEWLAELGPDADG